MNLSRAALRIEAPAEVWVVLKSKCFFKILVSEHSHKLVCMLQCLGVDRILGSDGPDLERQISVRPEDFLWQRSHQRSAKIGTYVAQFYPLNHVYLTGDEIIYA
jgi:hypothetical protein